MIKKRITIVFILLCCMLFLSFIDKKPFYIHEDIANIEEIRITKIFSTPNMEKEDSIKNVRLQNKKEIDDMISKLKSYSFRQTISFEKTVSFTTENITEFIISVYYKQSEQEWHYDRIQVSCIENNKTELTIICYNDSSGKEYKGKISNKTTQQFLEDMQAIFEKEE